MEARMAWPPQGCRALSQGPPPLARAFRRRFVRGRPSHTRRVAAAEGKGRDLAFALRGTAARCTGGDADGTRWWTVIKRGRPRDIGMFLILRYTGMRRESVATLKVKHLDRTGWLRGGVVK